MRPSGLRVHSTQISTVYYLSYNTTWIRDLYCFPDSGKETGPPGGKRSNMENKKSKKGLIAVIALVVVVIAALCIYKATRPAVSAGEKHITVEVVDGEGTSTVFEYDTDEEFLRGVLEPAGLIEGSDSDYGMFVTTVNGITADDSNQEWWCFTQDGEVLNTGVDTTPINDGDHFEITLTIGW